MSPEYLLLIPLIAIAGIVAIGILYTWALVAAAKADASSDRSPYLASTICPRCGAGLEVGVVAADYDELREAEP